MDIKNKKDFQPSSETLKKWLATRKADMNIRGNIVPGFFGDDGYSADTNWFYIAIAGEIAGLVATIYGAARGGPQFMTIAAVGVIMFIFCDLFFALKLHRNESQKCRLRSDMFMADGADNSQTIAAINKQLSGGKTLDFLLKMGIILIALIKVFAVILLGVFNSLALYLPFIVIFLIVAYVHIYHTGHFWAYAGTQKAINKEYDQYSSTTGDSDRFKATSQRDTFETPLPLVLPTRHARHEIVQNQEKGGNNYILNRNGILTDGDIQDLAMGQDDANVRPIIKACRRMQYAMLNA
jgi:hypothetical protein